MAGHGCLRGCAPFRTNMTPDHSDGSPGVRLTNMPSGHDCFSPVLQHQLGPGSGRGTEFWGEHQQFRQELLSPKRREAPHACGRHIVRSN